MSLPLPLKSGTLVGGHYIIDGLINRGGFGSVYRGIDTSEGDRPCAIKETYDVTPAARRQALMEAGILFTVRSKHLPRIYDAFEANGRFYLVMQLIEGQNLRQLLQARGMPCSEQEVLAWLLPIIEVLQELHSRNPAIIHRDIKPANIILTLDQTAVLVDFGLTKLYDPGSTTQTMVKAVTEGFSPPEQYFGSTTPQADIYSLAATMYYLLTGQAPLSALTRSLHDDLQPPRALNPSISTQVEQALLKALSLQPEQRYQSMREFADALQGSGFSAHAAPTIHDQSRASSSAPPLVLRPQAPAPAPLQAPVLNAPYPLPGPGYIPASSYLVMPQAMPQPPRAQRLPGAFGQGCLWGLIQGVLAALLVLFLKSEGALALAVLLGWLCYVWAGSRTTHRGGSVLRGGWAGLWAGITGTLVFWFVFVIGALILIAQRIQLDVTRAQQQGVPLRSQSQEEFARALHAVVPLFPQHPSAPASSSSSLATYVVGGLLLAFTLGWFGGILGHKRYEARQQKMQSP